MCTGIQLGLTWEPTNIVVIGELGEKGFARAVVCYMDWLRAAAPVPSASLHAPQETAACLHPAPLNVAVRHLEVCCGETADGCHAHTYFVFMIQDRLANWHLATLHNN